MGLSAAEDETRNAAALLVRNIVDMGYIKGAADYLGLNVPSHYFAGGEFRPTQSTALLGKSLDDKFTGTGSYERLGTPRHETNTLLYGMLAKPLHETNTALYSLQALAQAPAYSLTNPSQYAAPKPRTSQYQK